MNPSVAPEKIEHQQDWQRDAQQPEQSPSNFAGDSTLVKRRWQFHDDSLPTGSFNSLRVTLQISCHGLPWSDTAKTRKLRCGGAAANAAQVQK